MRVFQFLLLQDFGRTWEENVRIPKFCFSSFFFRTSAGLWSPWERDQNIVSVPSSSGLRPDLGPSPPPRGRPSFSSFFFRTSAGRARKSAEVIRVVSVPSSSGLRPDRSRRTHGPFLKFQFLLLQDFGRTGNKLRKALAKRFSSFFFRTSAGRHRCGRGLRHGFQFLLLQDFGRTVSAGVAAACELFQFLLLQDFGRTHNRPAWAALSCFSSFFFRTSAGHDVPSQTFWFTVSVPSSSGLRPDG